MVKVSDAFPSKYLAAADLEDRQVRVIMGHVEMETIGDDHKPVLYFAKSTLKKPELRKKGLVLNKTNSNTIKAKYGDEMDDWGGNELILFSMPVDFQGRQVDAIRVRIPKPQAAPATPPKPAEQEFDDAVEDIGDTF